MLGLRQTQRLSPILTQQLQQAIKLLQLSQLELMEAIELEINENPVLEIKEEEPEESIQEQTEEEPIEEKEDMTEWLELYTASEEISSEYANFEERNYPDYENMVSKTSNLRDYLRWQIGLSDVTQEERIVAEWILENIDDNGYLAYPISEIASASGFSVEGLEKILLKIQKLDPPGVGAQNLRECLLIQCRMESEKDPLLENFLINYFDLVEKGNIKDIVKKTGFPVDLVKSLIEKIKNYDPKPGRNFGDDHVFYMIPDVYVAKQEGEFDVFLNEEDIPELHVNSHYIELYANKSTNGEDRKYIKQKVKQAEWFIKSLQQRQRTLYLVAKSIVSFQTGFFEKGLKALKPLILKDVAQDIGMHESTVSRITTNKYISTPHGIYEMKFFFPTGIGKEEGNELSTNVVMDIIAEVIKDENKAKPFTDDEIVSVLKKSHNIKIARRTAAKYREELRIPSSRNRKSQ
ncbi:MAG: RNA polymerase factor sigma-54 [Syntrophobacterales bacterium]|jgi:RNA polymerase sigma-54 factor|nr:RNA polymerase factor sigma-54 [Syntrophobacterales bacterium]